MEEEVKGVGNKIDPTVKEILRKYKEGAPSNEIALSFEMPVSVVQRILKKYYKNSDGSIMDFTMVDVVRLYEKGVSENEIAKRLEIPISSVYNKLKKFYKEAYDKKRKEKEEQKVLKEKQIKELVIRMHKKEKTIEEICERTGKPSEYVTELIEEYTARERIKEERRKKEEEELNKRRAQILGEKKEKTPPEKVVKKYTTEELDAELMKILLNGNTINAWKIIKRDEENAENLRERLRRLRFVADRARKVDDVISPDENFVAVLEILKNPTIVSAQDKYMLYFRKYGIRQKGFCERGKTDLMMCSVFNGNKDLTAYVLSGMDLTYVGYDMKVWNNIKGSYEDKIAKYFNILHLLEEKNPGVFNKKAPDGPDFE